MDNKFHQRLNNQEVNQLSQGARLLEDSLKKSVLDPSNRQETARILESEVLSSEEIRTCFLGVLNYLLKNRSGTGIFDVAHFLKFYHTRFNEQDLSGESVQIPIFKILEEEIRKNDSEYSKSYSHHYKMSPYTETLLRTIPLKKELLEDLLDESNCYEERIFLYNQLNEEPDFVTRKTKEIFGDAANQYLYDRLGSIYDESKITDNRVTTLGDLFPEEFKKLRRDRKYYLPLFDEFEYFGVKDSGEAGVLQLEQGFAKFRTEMLNPNFNPDILIKSNFAYYFFYSQVRFSVAQWKGKGHSARNIIERYLKIQSNPEYEIAPLNEAYVPSETVYVDTIDKDGKPVEYTESFLIRFETINEDIKKAKELYLAKLPLTQITKRLDEKRTKIVEELNAKIEKIPNEKGKNALAQRLTTLKELQLRNLADFQKNFATLATFKELESDLRQAMFVMGFAKNRTELEKNLDEVDPQAPNLDDVTWAMNFVDHIVNKEVMSQYFTDKQALTKFRDLISVRSFEEELSRFQNQGKTGTLPMKFIPTRGILMEFSGHIADACWADKYNDTIPATFPNFTAVTMLQNPETKHERLCGSCMLIETEDRETGEPLLVIRGLNPIQNTINQLAVSDFYKKFTDYAKSLAEKAGRKLAIVIDSHSGGSATNRPLLFNYLSALELKPVRVHYDETEFNGYGITDNVYLAE